MNKIEYRQYQEDVADFMRTEGIDSLTADDMEPEFDWNSCDCCGTTLGGDRYKASGFNTAKREIYKYRVCPNCLYYSEYGQLDDMTMMEIEESEYFTAGWNLTGCLCDTDPEGFSSFDEAKQYILDTLQFEADYTEDENKAEQIEAAIQDINLESKEFSYFIPVLNYWYWVSDQN